MGLMKRMDAQRDDAIRRYLDNGGTIKRLPDGPAQTSRSLPIELKARIVAKYFEMNAQPAFQEICGRILERMGKIDNPKKWSSAARRDLIEKFHAEIAVPGSLWDCGKNGLKTMDKRMRRAARKKERTRERVKPPRRAMRSVSHTPTTKQAEWVNSHAFLESFEWRKLRLEVLKKHGARCQCCGATPADGVKMHVDHIKPRRRHPELALAIDNLQVLCEVCNHGKGNWDQTDWRPSVGN